MGRIESPTDWGPEHISKLKATVNSENFDNVLHKYIQKIEATNWKIS